ncbi:lipopolysaccharide biosynthesis protein [Alkalicoccobacillus murimartini]|uniref:O-antigen/teichoic acid export membrane protein n=1 Tax=Alkalicoccobacillus murimartini TaxID=171685 RepID=A0ABT9YGG1_9BACI|nr:oligosaccharide flippase family protein [Alkalicoccobacillus murimartini]MDQ0206915.1 O-antigen/teichoic acid export membrane protein [Alkalicoccobacillus murimartini]
MAQENPVNGMNVLKQKLLSGGIWAFLGKASTAVMVLVVNGLITRILEPADAGLYFLGFNIALFGGYFGLLGLEQTSVKFIAEGLENQKYKQVLSVIRRTSFFVACGTLVVGGCYYLAAVFLFGPMYPNSEITGLSAFIALWIAGNVFHLLLAEYFRGLHDIRLASIFGGFLFNLTLIFGLLLLQVFSQGPILITNVLSVTISSLAFSIVLGWIILLLKLRAVKKQPVQNTTIVSNRVLYSTGWPILGVTLSSFILQQSDLWIVGIVENAHTVALYGAALKLTAVVMMPIIVLNAVIAPIVAAKNGQGKLRELEPVLRLVGGIVTLPSLMLVVLFFFFAEQIMSIAFGSIYGGASLFLVLLSLKQLAIVWNGACGIIMMMADQHKKLMKISVVTGILALIFTIVFGLFFGGVGVAVGSLLANVICQVWMWKVVGSTMNLRTDASFKAIYDLIKSRNPNLKASQQKAN